MNNSGDGFYINGCSNGSWQPSNGNTIVNNEANNSDPNNASGNGFEATFSTDNKFISNRTSGKNFGFWLGFSDKSRIEGNVASGQGGAVKIENSICNAIINNTLTEGDDPSKIWKSNGGDCGTGKPKDCHDNLISGNQVGKVDCTNNYDQQLPYTSACGISLDPIPTDILPTDPAPTTSNPPQPTLTPIGDGGWQGGILQVEVYVTRNGQPKRLWSDTDGDAKVYIEGPTLQSPNEMAFSIVADVPVISGTCYTLGDPYERGAAQGFPYRCEPGTIFWEGAPRDKGTYPGKYNVKMFELPTGLTTQQTTYSVDLASRETKTVTFEIVEGESNPNQDTPTPEVSPTNGPSPTIAASGYTNQDFQKVIDQYGKEEISPLAVSAWITKATRVPGLQISICYPPNCEFGQ